MFPSDHVLTAAEQRALAEDIAHRAACVAADRHAMVRWDEVLYVDLSKPRFATKTSAELDQYLDDMERSGRVVARVGSRYILRGEQVPCDRAYFSSGAAR